MFAKFPLSFEFYGDDIKNGKIDDVPDLTQNVEKSILAEELKLSCTNVMLQCLDTESRCIFILGTMFRVDSRIAGDILGITPEAYRQRLSRIRAKMADFLKLPSEKYLIMEGCCDSNEVNINNTVMTKKAIMYSGKLDDAYGIKMLLAAFMQIKDDGLELWLTGGGNAEKYILEYILRYEAKGRTCQNTLCLLFHTIISFS